MNNRDWTKDRLIQHIIDSNERNTKALQGIDRSLNLLNDTNKAYLAREDDRYKTIEGIVAGNNKYMKLVTLIIVILLSAIVILAGAKEALNIVPNFL